jgi:putative redox protein
MENEVIVKIGKEKYQTEVQIGKHYITVDEPEEMNGKDLGPKPTTLLLSSLGTCKAITMKMYADMKNWPLEGIEIALDHSIDKTDNQHITNISIQIKLLGDLDEVQKERILKVSEKCPVQKILSNPIQISTNMIQ